jgi:diguanylate cyclase (GGDEF)-like protein/PAS domain S-box-containing protein
MEEKIIEPQSNWMKYLLNELPAGVIVIDEAGMIQFKNEKAQEMLNPDGGDLLFQPFGYQVSVDAVTEIEIHRLNQTMKLLESRARQINWENQPATLITLVDISDSLRSESALRKSQEKFSKLFHANPDCVLLTNLVTGKILDVNQGFINLFGYYTEEVIGKTTAEIHLWSDITDRDELLKRLLATGECMDYETLLVTKDGWVMPVNISEKTLEVGNEMMSISIIRDISQYKNSERALQKANDKLSLWIDELEQRNRESGLMNEMGDMLQSCLSLEEAYKVVGRYAEELFVGQTGALYVFNAERKTLQKKIEWGEKLDSMDEFEPEDCWAIRRGTIHEMTGNKNPLLCNHVQNLIDERGFIQNICFPLIAQGETLGSLYLQLQPGQDIEHWKQLGIALAERAALDFANQRLRYKLHQQSIRDPLTGLFNRRYMEETLHREIRRSVRHSSQLSVAMIDVDFFKKFNDKYGHEVGDRVLKEMAGYLQNNLRVEDIVCRFGGEEFIVILPDASMEDTIRRANQWRESIKKINVGHYDQMMDHITISVGVACFPVHGNSVDTLLRTVDDALYAAKHAGRDCVISADEMEK